MMSDRTECVVSRESTRATDAAGVSNAGAGRHEWRLVGPAGSLRRHLVTAMSGVFVLNFTQKVLMLVLTVLLARYMGPHDYGVYASAYAAVVLVEMPASLGLPNLIVRQVAVGRQHSEWALIRGLLTRSVQAALVVSVILAGALWMLQAHLIASGGYTLQLLWLAYAILPLILLGAMRNNSLRGLNHVALGMLPETLIVPVLFIGGVLIVHTLTPGALTPTNAMALRLVAVGVAFVVGAACLWGKLPAPVRTSAPAYQTGTWLRAAAPMMWVGAMSTVTTQIDVLMLAAIKGPTAAGIYQVAARGAELVAFVSTIGNIALQPTIARLYAAGDLARLKRITRIATRGMLAAALLVAICYLLLGRSLLHHIFGAAFVAAAPALLVLSLGWVLIAALGPVRDTLLMIGGERQAAISISFAALGNVVLNAVLIPPLGVTGAASATTLALISCYMGYAWCVRRRLGFVTSLI